MRLRIKVAAGASRDRIDGWLGDTLKLRVRAAPERGKANVAVERLLADTLGVAVSEVRIVSGHASSSKIVELDDMTDSELARRLSPD